MESLPEPPEKESHTFGGKPEHRVSEALKRPVESIIKTMARSLRMMLTATDNLPCTDMLYDARVEARECLRRLKMMEGGDHG